MSNTPFVQYPGDALLQALLGRKLRLCPAECNVGPTWRQARIEEYKMKISDLKVGARVKCVFYGQHFGKVGTISKIQYSSPDNLIFNYFLVGFDNDPAALGHPHWTNLSSFELISAAPPSVVGSGATATVGVGGNGGVGGGSSGGVSEGAGSSVGSLGCVGGLWVIGDETAPVTMKVDGCDAELKPCPLKYYGDGACTCGKCVKPKAIQRRVILT